MQLGADANSPIIAWAYVSSIAKSFPIMPQKPQLSLLAFFTGIWGGCYLETLPGIGWLGIAMLPGLVLRQWLVCRLFLAVMTGMAWLVIYTSVWGMHDLPAALEGETLDVTGVVTSIPQPDALRTRFDFQIQQVIGSEWQGTVRLNWYRTRVALKAGQQWKLKVKLKRRHGFSNPGGFDYEAWLFQQGIAATGYVRQPASAAMLGHRVSIDYLRQALSNRLLNILPDNAAKGMIITLVTGDRQYMRPAQWQVLSRTGTLHLMAISGLHIGLVFGWFYVLGKWLWRRSARLCSLRPAQDAALLAGWFAALVYAALAGFALPTQRALIMLSVLVFVLLTRRCTDHLNILLLALVVVIVIDPYSVLSAAFWLSFMAVAVIFLYLRHRPEDVGQARQLIHIQFVIALGLLPLSLVFFQQQSLVAPLANLLAVPFAGLVIVPLSLLGSLLHIIGLDSQAWVLWLASQAMQQLWWLLEVFNAGNVSVWVLPQPPFYLVVLAGLGVVILFSRSGWRWRLLGVSLLLSVLLPVNRWTAGAGFQVDFLDVGQGLAIVVRTANYVMLYDTGFRANARFDVGQQVIVPYLRHQGIRRLDKIVLSHDDKDHVGGFSAVAREIEVGRVMQMPGSVLDLPQDSSTCMAGEQWQWDGVQFDVLYPFDKPLTRGNNRSCVIRISQGMHSVLLTGDIEAEAERQLSRYYADRLQSHVVSSPHHGSATSSTTEFIQHLDAAHVVHSAGYRNRFGFPRPDVVQRYRQAGVRQWHNDMHGMVRFVFFPQQEKPWIQTYRQTQKRFWRSVSADFK